MKKLILLVALMLLIARFAHAQAPASQPASAPTIKNATVEFNGATYYLVEHDPALPAHLIPALVRDTKGHLKSYLLRASKKKVEQAIETISSYDGIVLTDLDGDGQDEIILPCERRRFAEVFPRAKVFSVYPGIEYNMVDAAPGMHHVRSTFTSGVGDVLRTTSSGDLESIVGPTFSLSGVSTYGRYTCTFADLFGDGRPIPCETVTWTTGGRFAIAHPTKAELESYRWPDKPGGKWADEPIHLAIPDGPDLHASLKGILNPATFKPTAIMLQRDRIRAILPNGWTASITSADELSIQPAGPVSYCRATDLQERGRDFVAAKFSSPQSNVVSLFVRVLPRDDAPAGSDILTADHRITVWNGIMSKGDVFFDPAVGKQYAEVEAAVRRAVAAPTSAPATQSQ